MSGGDLRRWLQQALEHHGAGRLAEAEGACRRVLEADGDNAPALHCLGVIALQRGRHADALELIGRAARLAPGDAAAHANLGNALQALGRYEEAARALRRALSLAPAAAAVRANLANALAQAGTLAEAIEHYEAALAAEPGLAEARRNLAVALLETGRPGEALRHVEPLARARPGAVGVQLTYANTLQALRRHDEAIACFERLVQARPTAAPLRCSLGNALREAGRPGEAAACYERALALDERYAEASYGLGLVRQDAGDLGAALAAFRRALALDPRCTKAWRAIVALSPPAVAEADAEAMTALARAGDLSGDQRMHLRFALGRACELARRDDEAMGHYAEANRLRRRRIDYDVDRDVEVMARIRQVCDAPWLERWVGAGVADATPIFIVGMPRSGSTLVEQVLASHPAVCGGGELMLLPQAVASRLTLRGGVDYTGALERATREDLREIAGRYVEDLRALAPQPARVTDKLLGNFLYLGLIAVMFPQASVVHCVRDPRDTCLSIYRHYFADRGHQYAYELGELGRYYRAHAELMAHWRELLGARLHEVRYESLVADQEATTRELLAACSLPWDEACLRFHETERTVATHSAAQVRQPLYRQSVGAWRRFERFLAPLLRELPTAGDG